MLGLNLGLMQGGRGIPRQGLLAWCKNGFSVDQQAFVDAIGLSSRPLKDLQYIAADGTGYFVNSDLVTAGITVTSVTGEGTTTYSSPSAGRINMTDGTASKWSTDWSDGKTSIYSHCTLVSATVGVCFDQSGNGRNLLATGFVDLALTCLSGKIEGSDTFNLLGYTVADGTQYYDTEGVDLIPEGALIPSLADGSGCCAYLSDGSVAPLTYPGRAKYNILPKSAPCVAFNGTGYIVIGSVITLSGDFEISSYFNCTSYTSARCIVGGSSATEGIIRIGTAGYIQIYINGTGYSFWDAEITPGIEYIINVKRIGLNVTVTVINILSSESVSQTLSATTSDVIIRSIGAWGAIDKFLGKIYGIYINGVRFPLCESAGDAGTNNTVRGCDASGNTYTATLTGFSSIPDAWSTQNEYFYALENGSRIVDGLVIPGNPITGLACDGNALTDLPLKFSDANKYARPDADQVRAATRWEYGTDNGWFDEDGNPNEFTWTAWKALTDGQTEFANDKYGDVLYELTRPASSTIKSARLFGGYTAPDLADMDLEYDVFY